MGLLFSESTPSYSQQSCSFEVSEKSSETKLVVNSFYTAAENLREIRALARDRQENTAFSFSFFCIVYLRLLLLLHCDEIGLRRRLQHLALVRQDVVEEVQVARGRGRVGLRLRDGRPYDGLDGGDGLGAPTTRPLEDLGCLHSTLQSRVSEKPICKIKA